MRNERWVITNNITEILNSIIEYYEQIYGNKLDK